MPVVSIEVKEMMLQRLITTLILCFAVSVYGCSGSADQDGPQYGGEVVIGSQTVPDNLNPLISGTTVAVNIQALLFSGLTKQDSVGAPVPDLAERWLPSEDGLTYTFYMRTGVRFHDGVECTAEDVKFTYDAAKEPKYRQAWSSLNMVESVEVVDRYTVRISLNRVEPQFLNFGAGFSIVPHHLLEQNDDALNKFNQHPIGTGPFKFYNWADSTRVILAANESYFGGRPYLDRVVYRVGLSRSTQWELLMRQEIDTMITPLLPEDIEYVRSDSMTFRLYSGLEPWYHMIMYNHDDAQFSDRRIRRAISYGLDKQAIISRALKGEGILVHGPFGENSWGNDPTVQPVPYDPQISTRMLEEAGWRDRNEDGILEKNGRLFEVTLLIIEGDKSAEMTSLMTRQNLQKIGIRVVIEKLDARELLDTRISTGRYEMALLPYSFGRDPSATRNLFRSNQFRESGAVQNFLRFRNTQIDSLFDADDWALPQQERERIYRRIHTILAEEQPVVFLYTRYYSTPVAMRIADIKRIMGTVDFSSINKWHVAPQY